MTVSRANGMTSPLKYLSYWIKRSEGWRVLAYRRILRPAGAVSMTMMPPALPTRAVVRGDIGEADKASLMAAEQAFSNEAQRIGLGPAFAKNGHVDAMNMGQAPNFIIGAAAIGEALDQGSVKSRVRWASDDAVVAGSGDLGLSWGRIYSNAEPGRPPATFFTVWKRETRDSPWRYIAE